MTMAITFPTTVVRGTNWTTINTALLNFGTATSNMSTNLTAFSNVVVKWQKAPRWKSQVRCRGCARWAKEISHRGLGRYTIECSRCPGVTEGFVAY